MPRKSNAKERILNTAGELFAQRGYSEVGINEIIDKAETAKATFYQHFPSKELLCEAWLDTMHERSEHGRSAVLECDDDPAKKIDAYFEGLCTYMKNSDFRGCNFSNTGAIVGPECAGIRGQIEGHKISIRDFFKALALQLIGDEKRSREVGDSLFLLYSGAASEAQNLREIWPAEAARTAAREICEREKNR